MIVVLGTIENQRSIHKNKKVLRNLFSGKPRKTLE